MEITGEYRLAAPRTEVWTKLLDPAVLQACIPGCKQLVQTGDDSYDAKIQLKIGPVSATFLATVEMLDIDEPRGCRLVGRGNGGVAGFAKGECRVDLAEDGEGTVLTYRADTEIGGKIAALGNRLMQATSKKLADQFFNAFAQR